MSEDARIARSWVDNADAWVDCDFPHMEQTGRIRLEWLETIDEPFKGEKGKAIKAVDPTPGTAPRDSRGSSEG